MISRADRGAGGTAGLYCLAIHDSLGADRRVPTSQRHDPAPGVVDALDGEKAVTPWSRCRSTPYDGRRVVVTLGNVDLRADSATYYGFAAVDEEVAAAG